MNNLKLPNNKYVTVSVLHIRTIPHLSLLGDGSLTPADNEFVVEDNKIEFGNLLSQVYQFYAQLKGRGCERPEIALEILWITHAVERQPYKASIEFYIVIRSINESLELASKLSEVIRDFCQTSLSLQWYDFEEVPPEDLEHQMEGYSQKAMAAVVKESRMIPLPLDQMPECFLYDIIPHSKNDFRKLAGTLIGYPQTAVWFQLMPTEYDQRQKTALMQMSQMLSTLSSGVKDSQMGQTEIQAAAAPAKVYNFYAGESIRALFNYNIIVAGTLEAVTALGARVIGMLTEGIGYESRANFKLVPLKANEILRNPKVQIYTMPWHVSAVLHENCQIQNVPEIFRSLPSILSLSECTNFFGLPIASKRLGAGLKVNETGKQSRTYADGIINSGDIRIGKMHSSLEDEIGIRLSDLAKHMLIVGTPGSGKTTFSVGLLHRLWVEHHIPFLVIEPAKNEYRALIQAIPELQVFTPGKNDVSPFVFNPFVPPENVRLQAYKSVLKTAFAAGVSMTTPLDKIFEDSVSNCYADFRWLESYTKEDGGEIFNISDFVKCFQETFDSIGYTGDSRNIGRAGLVRLKGLEKLFDNYFSIPIHDILTKPTVIELAAIENADEKALYISLILLSVLSYVNANYVGQGGLRNFILLEEAHVLLDADSHASEGAANPAAIAQGLVKRMLAEIRSYGVGLGIADQSPRKVGLDIVALTDIKVAFRLVESSDKQLVGDSSGMDYRQVERLSKLKPGEAFFFYNRLEAPEEIVTPDYRLENKIDISLSDRSIASLSTYWLDKQKELRPYPECKCPRCCSEKCDYSRRLLAREVSRRIYHQGLRPNESQKEPLFAILKNLSILIKRELNNESFTPELVSCVKVHLMRKVKFETKIKLSQEVIDNYLKK